MRHSPQHSTRFTQVLSPSPRSSPARASPCACSCGCGGSCADDDPPDERLIGFIRQVLDYHRPLPATADACERLARRLERRFR